MIHVYARTAARIYLPTDFIVWAFFYSGLVVNIGIVNKFALNALHATVVQNMIYTYTYTHTQHNNTYVILYVDVDFYVFMLTAATPLLSHEH